MKFIEKYKEIKSFTNTKFNKNIGDFFITRPLSILLTIPLADLNISPNRITSIRVILQMIVILFIFFSNKNYLITLIILHYFFSDVFDYVDGNYARYKNKASYFGKLFDTTFDNSLSFIFLISIIFNLNNNNYDFKFLSSEYYFFIIAIYIICFWFEKYSSLLAKKFLDELKTKETNLNTKTEIPEIKVTENNSNNLIKNMLMKLINFFTFIKINVYGVIPIIFFITGLFEYYFILLFLSFFAHFILVLPLNFKNYYSILNIHRISNIDIRNKK